MLQQASGCFSISPCESFTKSDKIVKNGEKFIKPCGCDHHPDRFAVPSKSKRGKKALPGPVAEPEPVEAVDWSDEENA